MSSTNTVRKKEPVSLSSVRRRFGALAIALTLPLVACQKIDDSTQEATENSNQAIVLNTYQSVDQCISAKVFTPDFCREADKSARNSLPFYQTAADCKKESWDDCRTATTPEERVLYSHIPFGYYFPSYQGFMIAMNSSSSNSSPVMRTRQTLSARGLTNLRFGVSQKAVSSSLTPPSNKPIGPGLPASPTYKAVNPSAVVRPVAPSAPTSFSASRSNLSPPSPSRK